MAEPHPAHREGRCPSHSPAWSTSVSKRSFSTELFGAPFGRAERLSLRGWRSHTLRIVRGAAPHTPRRADHGRRRWSGRPQSSRTTAGEWRKNCSTSSLVLVAGRRVADGAAEAHRLDEVGDRARRRVPVVEPGALERAGCRRPGRSGAGRAARAAAPRRAGAAVRSAGSCRSAAGARCARHRWPPPRSTAAGRRRPRCRCPARRVSRTKRIARMTSSSWTNWKRGSKPNMLGTIGSSRALASGVAMSGPEHVGEPQHRDGDVRVVHGEVAHVALDLEEAPLDHAARRLGAAGLLGEPHRVLRRGAVDERRGLHDHVAHRRARRRRRGEQVHRADHVDLVHRARRHLRGVDDQEGVDDRVDLGRLHDAGEDRVALVAAHELGALELRRSARTVSRPTMTSTVGSASRAWATRPPQKVASPVTRTRLPTHPNQTDWRCRSMS